VTSRVTGVVLRIPPRVSTVDHVDIPQDELTDVVKRLRRIEGQIGGIVRMIEDGRDCSAVVTQLAAASKALSKAGFAVVSTGMRHCSTNSDGDAREIDLRELERLFLSLA
jgi:DNA-binding FrmR family transcriptional regulator